MPMQNVSTGTKYGSIMNEENSPIIISQNNTDDYVSNTTTDSFTQNLTSSLSSTKHMNMMRDNDDALILDGNNITTPTSSMHRQQHNHDTRLGLFDTRKSLREITMESVNNHKVRDVVVIQEHEQKINTNEQTIEQIPLVVKTQLLKQKMITPQTICSSSESLSDDQSSFDESNMSYTSKSYRVENFISYVKCLYSMALLIFSIIIVMSAMFTRRTVATTGENDIPPMITFIIFWLLIVWLAIMEGGQGCLVGLRPIDKSIYVNTHPISYMNTLIAHKRDNMERFIIGRQFLVVIVFFIINMMTASINDAKVLHLNNKFNDCFLGSGIAVMMITTMLGQLTGQVNAAICMLDYINNYVMLFTTYISLAIEASGLLHSVYLVQIFFSNITGKSIKSSNEVVVARSPIQNIFFWTRVFISLLILGMSFTVTLKALFEGKTTMYGGIPKPMSVIIFFVLMCFVGMMEGMQIALFAVVNLPNKRELSKYPMATKVCNIAFTGNNLQAFLIGRQICVTICMFIVARVTSINVDVNNNDDSNNDNLFGVNDKIQIFFNTGLLGAIITTIVASLAWRIIASSFPIAFVSNPIIYIILRFCLLLERSGICSVTWYLARIQKQILGFKLDTEYYNINNSQKRTGSNNNT